VLVLHHYATVTPRTNVWMVLRQYSPLKLKRLLFHPQSILVPPDSRVRAGEIEHCFT